jgi:hypothetical protein
MIPIYEKLLLENKSWASEMVKKDPEYFNRLAHLQTPEFLWIGCSDSRVPANEIIHNSTLDSSRLTALTGWTPRDPLSVIDEVFRDKTGRSTAANRL